MKLPFGYMVVKEDVYNQTIDELSESKKYIKNRTELIESLAAYLDKQEKIIFKLVGVVSQLNHKNF